MTSSMPDSFDGSGGPFGRLDDSVLVHLALCFDGPSLSNVLQTCRLWRDLERTQRRPLWRSFLYQRYGPLRLSPPQRSGDDGPPATQLGSAWRDLAVRLSAGRADYAGAAIDAFTFDFEPYPMHLHRCLLHPGLAAAGVGLKDWIRWPTLRNSTTKLGNVKFDRDGRIQFSEILLLEGSGILIPNHYVGFRLGSAIVGVYPNGAFYLLLEEATSTSKIGWILEQERSSAGTAEGRAGLTPEECTAMLRGEERPSCSCWPFCRRRRIDDAISSRHVGDDAEGVAPSSTEPEISYVPMSPSDDGASIGRRRRVDVNEEEEDWAARLQDFDVGLHRLVMRPGLTFRGLLAMEHVPFQSYQSERHPNPVCVGIELEVTEAMSAPVLREWVRKATAGSTAAADDVVPLADVPQPGFAGFFFLRGRPDPQVASPCDDLDDWTVDYAFSVILLPSSPDRCPNEYNLTILVASVPVAIEPDGQLPEVRTKLHAALKMQKTLTQQDEHPRHHFLAEFLSVGSRMYTWIHGDNMIGILKNPSMQTGSFNLQLSRLGVPGVVGGRGTRLPTGNSACEVDNLTKDLAGLKT